MNKIFLINRTISLKTIIKPDEIIEVIKMLYKIYCKNITKYVVETRVDKGYIPQKIQT